MPGVAVLSGENRYYIWRIYRPLGNTNDFLLRIHITRTMLDLKLPYWTIQKPLHEIEVIDK